MSHQYGCSVRCLSGQVTRTCAEDSALYSPSRYLLGCRFLLKRSFCLIDDRSESLLVAHRQLRQNLAIESNARRSQSFGEAAVGESVGPNGGVQPQYPKHPEIAFTRFAIAVGPVLTLHCCVFGVTEEL